MQWSPGGFIWLFFCDAPGGLRARNFSVVKVETVEMGVWGRNGGWS